MALGRLRILLPGFLFFIAFYNISAGWVLSTVVIDRVLYYRVSLYPLTFFHYLDYMVSAALMIAISMIYRVRLPALLAAAPLLIYLFSEYLGLAFVRSVASIPMLISVLVPGRRLFRDSVAGFLVVLTMFEAIAIMAALSYFANGDWVYGLDALISRERQLWALPELVAVAGILVASVLWLVLKITGRGHPFPSQALESQAFSTPVRGRWLLSLALILVWLLILLPHLPTVNPGLRPVSVDTHFYTRFLLYADEHGLVEALKRYYPDRPLYMILIYGLYKIYRDPVILMDIIHPLIALSLLVVVTYIVTKRFFGEDIAGIAAILTATGHWSLGFIAGGFQANSLALPIFLLAFILRGKWILLAPFILLLGTAIHPWTLLIAAPAYIIHLARLAIHRPLIRISAIIYTTAVLSISLLLLDTLSATITGKSAIGSIIASTRIDRAIRDPLATLLGIGSITTLIGNIYRAFQLYAWGSINTAPILLLASLSSRASPATAFLAVAPIAVLLAGKDYMLIYRIFLNIPLEICAAQAIASLGSRAILTAILIASAARALILLTGLSPLIGRPWE